MLYSDKFLESLKNDPIAGVKEACNLALRELAENSSDWTKAELEALEEADVLMLELRAAELLPVAYSLPLLQGDASRGKRAGAIRSTLIDVLKELEKLEIRARREQLASRFRLG